MGALTRERVSAQAVARRAVEPELIIRFVSGDQQAFGQVFDRLQADLFYVVRRFFRGAFDQEEALQEIWLKIYRMRDRFDVNRADEFVAWVRQVARNRCLDLLKERGRAHEIPVAELEASCDAPQLEELTDQRLVQAVAEFKAGLGSEEARAFQLCFVEERSHEEAAAALGISVRRSKYLKKKLVERLTRIASLRAAREASR